MKTKLIALLNSRKTERGAKQFPACFVVRAAPFALLLLIVLGCAGMASARVVAGVGVGVGPAYGYYVAPPPPYVPPAPAYVAPAPRPNYSWIGGYWYPHGGHYLWHAGYWGARPFWVAPRYYGGRYYTGHWRR